MLNNRVHRVKKLKALHSKRIIGQHSMYLFEGITLYMYIKNLKKYCMVQGLTNFRQKALIHACNMGLKGTVQ
jgi:hypothetical protein